MEFIPKVKLTQNEAIMKPEAMELFPTVNEFARMLSKEVDSVFLEFMKERVGPDWKYELVEVIQVTANDSTMPFTRYTIMYDGEPIGRIRFGVAVQENKAIGNVFVEMEEKKAV